ncbi:MAG: hypothetical protein ABI647_14880, partial [Gemmatimonadota bacterium]
KRAGDSTFTVKAVTAATIFDYDSLPYPPLGIQPGFNCLYMWADAASYHASVVPVDEPLACKLIPAQLSATLDVHVWNGGSSKVNVDDIPPVARWQWEASAGGYQYIGLRCDGWCMVVPRKFPQPAMATQVSSPVGISPAEGATYTIPGWGDEQALAPPGGSNFAPSDTRGEIVPVADLETLNAPSDFRDWRLVAKVYIEDDSYQSKFGFKSTWAYDSPNRVSLCAGGPVQDVMNPTPTMQKKLAGCRGLQPSIIADKSCKDAELSSATGDEIWFAKIAPADSSPERFHCVLRRDHSTPSLRIPGTVRWRWVANDETMWMRCMFGCCQLY